MMLITKRTCCVSASVCPESTDEEVDKLHCLNHSGSSATYSDYSPSQGSSGSSNPPGNTHSHTLSHGHPHNPALPPPSKDQAPQTHWTNRYARPFSWLLPPAVRQFLSICNLLHPSSCLLCQGQRGSLEHCRLLFRIFSLSFKAVWSELQSCYYPEEVFFFFFAPVH